MATRYYFPAGTTDTLAAEVSPAINASWAGSVAAFSRRLLIPKAQVHRGSALFSSPSYITTNGVTQNLCMMQFVSRPIAPQTISGTISLVIKCVETALTANLFLAVVLRVMSQDGTQTRGTLYATFVNDTEYPTTSATRIVNAQAVTPVTTQYGDRLVLEVGAQATAPTASTTGGQIWILDTTLADYALTSGLTTNINPWMELSANIYEPRIENYKSIKVGDGMSVGERVR